jgi:hypothetical protein
MVREILKKKIAVIHLMFNKHTELREICNNKNYLIRSRQITGETRLMTELCPAQNDVAVCSLS